MSRDGYEYTESNHTTRTTTLSITFADGVGTGTLVTESEQTFIWTESDEWEPDVIGLFTGQLEFFVWLVDAEPNYSDVVNCASDPCTLTMTVTLTEETPVQVRRTDLSDDAFDGLSDVGQDAGL